MNINKKANMDKPFFIHDSSSNQTAMFNENNMVVIKEERIQSLYPLCVKTVYRVEIFENIEPDYKYAFSIGQAGITLGKAQYERKISKLINTILK